MATQSVRTSAIASRASSVASRGRDPRVDRRCVSCSHGKNPSHWNRELMSIELTSPPPPPSHYRSRLSAARRPPSRWSTARRARVLFASTVRIPPLSDCRCARRKIFRVLGLREAEAPGNRPARATGDRPRRGGAREVHLECAWDVSARAIVGSRRRVIGHAAPSRLARPSGGHILSSPFCVWGGATISAAPDVPRPSRRTAIFEPNRTLTSRVPSPTQQAPPLSSSSPRLSSSRLWSPSSSSVASASRTSTFASA